MRVSIFTIAVVFLRDYEDHVLENKSYHVLRNNTFILKCDFTYPERLGKLGLSPLEFRGEVLDFCFFFTCLKRHIDFDLLSYVSFKSYKYDNYEKYRSHTCQGSF